MPIADYYKEFIHYMEVKITEKCGAEFASTIQKEWSAQEIYDKSYTTLKKGQKEQADTDAIERYLAIIFILNVNKKKFATYNEGCSKSFQAYKQNTYPKMSEAAYEAP